MTHFVPNATPEALLKFMTEFVQKDFDAAPPDVRTISRKAVAHLDEVMNYDFVHDAQGRKVGS